MRRAYLSGTLFCGILILLAGCGKQPAGEITLRDGLTMRYTDMGTGDPVFILVHGWGNDRTIWTEQMQYLGGKYRMIALDLPGFGQSDYNRQDWSMEAFSRDLLEVIEQLKLENVVLVGFSMGAGPCVEAASTGAEAIKAVVIVDSLQDPERIVSQQFIDRTLEFMMLVVENDGLDFDAEPNPFFQQRTVEARELVINMLGQRINKERTGWAECLKQALLWQDEKCALEMKQLDVPVIGIFSTNESVNEGFYNKQVKQVELHIIENTGHVVMWDDAAAFNRIMDDVAVRIATE